MPHPISNPLICPVCHMPLLEGTKNCHCEQGHSFDVARQGYLNLLLSHQKHSHQPGDNKAMVAARHNFLKQGHYLPIYSALENTVLSQLAAYKTHDKRLLHIADIGCGEGYYTRKLDEKLATNFHVQSWGIDISKEAILCAGKTPSKVKWLIATLSRLPFADQSMDLLYALFCPLRQDAIQRVLKPEGLFIQLKPGQRHLLQLRELIYPNIKIQRANGPSSIQNEDQNSEPSPTLKLIDTHAFNSTLSLSNPFDIDSLFKMTPHYWRSSPESHRIVAELNQLDTEIDVEIFCYQNVDSY